VKKVFIIITFLACLCLNGCGGNTYEAGLSDGRNARRPRGDSPQYMQGYIRGMNEAVGIK
jgi:hypothetical protein